MADLEAIKFFMINYNFNSNKMPFLSFAKKARRFYTSGSARGIQAQHANKLRMQLAALDTALTVDDLDIPGYRLHPLRGNRQGIWSITVSGNWRVTFEFTDGNVYIVNYEDYH